MKKSHIIFFLLVTLLFGNEVFAQSETPTKNESDVVEIPSTKVSNDEEICNYRGESCRKRSEILESIKEIKSKIVRDKKPEKDDNWVDYFVLGVEYFYIRDYGEALSALNKVEPDHLLSDLTVYCGLIYLGQGKNDAALKEFNNLLSGTSNNSLAYFGRAEVYRHKRKYDEALKDYNRALEINHRLSKAYFGRGIVYLKRADILRQNKNEYPAEAAYRSALKDFDTVIEIDLKRTTSETYLYRSKVYEALGDDFNAEKDRKKADELAEKP